MSILSIISFAWTVLQSFVDPITQPYRYVMSSRSYAEDLEKEVENLAHEADRVEDIKEKADNNVQDVFDWVADWQASAKEALEKARDLLKDFEKATDKICCHGTLPDPICLYQFSEEADNKIKSIKQLIEKTSAIKEMNDISFSGRARGNVIPRFSASGKGKGVVGSTTASASASSASTSDKLSDDGVFESRDLLIQKIMEALADNSHSVVGVYGMGGVGKSTLLVDAERRIREEGSFDLVAKANVLQNPDIKSIQEEIAFWLGLDIIKKEENVGLRAELLRERLQKEEKEKKRKVLIILDDLWRRLDLSSVGIPCGYDNKVIGCKLLLTSRDRDVLQREMACNKVFLLDSLPKEEAKRLFERIAEEKAHEEEYKFLVDDALRKCAGLPFLIIALAKRFKHAALSEWKYTLEKIERSRDKGTNEVINDTLQLSYDGLEEEVKLLLRLCVVYGVSNPSLENLVRYGVGLELFQEVSNIEGARCGLSTMIHTLQASSLLLDDGDADSFKIHDLVRGFVTLVSSRDDPLLVWRDNDNSVTELPKDKLKSCTAVCFPYIDMKELPEEFDCPEMQIFLLFANDKSLKIPDSYFNSMRKLMVLHLSRVRLTSSPSLFKFLENLHTLCLHGCSLEDVAMIGELKGLHILSFMNSIIHRLPNEIGQLVKLRLLDLSGCSQLEMIEPGVLGSLMKLEELYMENSFDQWNAMEQTPPINAELIELNNMKNLCTLHVSIPDPMVLPEDLNVEKLTKYKIQIGDVEHWRGGKGLSTLEIKLDPTSNILQKGCIQTFLSKTDDLFLDGLNGIEQSICLLSQRGFQKLKHLHVKNSPSVHYILQSSSHTDFKALESLILDNLINLEKICNNHISTKSFSAVKEVRVESCDKMEVLFPLSLLRELPQLEEMRIVNCHLMREIIEVDDCSKIELRNLRALELRDLPNMRNFFTAEMAPSSSTSNNQVGTQVAFFNGQWVSIPSLESLTMARLPNLEDLWTDESPSGLSNLQFLELFSCKSLSRVINSRSLVKLHKLHTLRVIACVSVREIFCLDGLGADANIETLSELNTIHIGELPNLMCIWNKNPCEIVKFHDLKKLKVDGCNNLRFLFFPSMVQSLAQLRELDITHCKKMEAIIMEEEGLRLETLVFPMLTNLLIRGLESLTCFSRRKCSVEAQGEDHIQSRCTTLFNREVAFPSLETLDIGGMDNIEIIWDNQVAADSFRKLKSLMLWRCNKLLNIVPSCILGQLKSLENLVVRSCSSLEVVFKLQPLNPLDGHPVVDLPLQRLVLNELPELKCVLEKELHCRVKFQCLRFVTISKCKSLASLFPALVAIHLTQLEELEIDECGIVELIEKEDGLVPKFVFPKLTSLKLEHLTELKCIYTGKHALYWPTLKTLRVCGCDKVEILALHLENEMPLDKQPLFLIEKVSIPSLESLTMARLPNLEDLWTDVSPLGLSNLQFLKVSLCKSLSKVINSRSLIKLNKLNILTVETCISVQEIFDLDGLGPGANIGTLSELNTIYIHGLPSLSCIWNKNPCGIMRFHNLEKLQVHGCDNLRFLLFPSMVQSLAQLRKLNVRDCKNMEAIIMEEEGLIIETSETLVFPMLTDLQFVNLESWTCFSRKKCTPKARDEDRIKSCCTILFNQEVAFPSLETLDIEGMDNIEIIWDNQVAADSFHKLKSLKLWRCNKLLNVVPSCILGQLKSLEKLVVRSCSSLEVVFKLQPLNPLDGHPVVDLPLQRLVLNELPELKCVWDKELHRRVKFQCLRSITISDCKSLASLFPASVAIHLIQLEELEIDKCGIVELIEKEDGLVPRFVFPKLTSLKLKHLTKLKCIYIGKHASYWPALKTLRVRGCDKVEIFASHLENETSLDKQPLFLIEKVAFPHLETLNISDMDNIEIIWDNQVAADSFHKLKSLEVWRCNKLLNIFPSCILGRLKSLESLEVGSCDSLEVVFKLQPLNPLDGHPVAHLPLKMLELDGLPKLKCVWDKDLHNQVKFQCLCSVTVSECKSLASLFPTSVAIHLTELDELKIDECGIVELIEKEDELVPKFVFPKLTSFRLAHLTELKCIYIGKHASHWPALKTLKVLDCDKVEIFASHPENEMPLHKQPLFLIEKGAFPNLQELKLDLFGQMEIWHGHFHDGEFFTNLRVLELHHFSKELAIFTCCFVQSLANLEKLIVCKSYREELNVSIEAIASLSDELEVILPSSFQHLKTLEVLYCDGLSPYEILPFSTFFQHLETLDMSFCDGLSNIFTPTIARNLVELTKLRISNCKMLTEVICDEEGEEGLMVAFNQLKYIELDRLIRLRCFSSIKYTLVFPLLEDVIVSGCPDMKFFSGGPIEAPNLDKVQVSTKAWFWKENLNITIQNMFEEMEMVATVKFMRLSEFPELIGKWHSELNPLKLSWQLKSLMVDKCPSFVNAIPSKLMLLLVNMRRLQVCDCESLEEIFDLEGLVGLGSTGKLPSSMTLDLVNLPKLRRLWNKDLQGSLPYNFLYYITLYNCSNLRHAFNPSMVQCLANLSRVEIKECDRMEGVIEEEEGQRSALEKITFPNLKRMKLECLPNLTSFLLGKNQMLECPKLIELTIACCPKMSSLTRQSLLEIDHYSPSLFSPQVQFPQLASMVLSHMDNLIKIWTDSPQDTLPFEHLRNVNVENCKSLEILFPHWVATSLTQLQKLRVESCGIEQMVTSGDDISHFTIAQFHFPQLISLVFHDMPQLKGFCPDLHTLKWQFLEELRVTHCDKLNMLSFVASMNKWAQRDNQHNILDHEAHLSFEKGIPTLERLLLVDKDIHTIQSGKFSDNFFRKPKALTLACFHDENVVFPPIFLLRRFKNLQSLEVLCSSFEDIFLDEELVDEGKHLVLDNLKELKLSKLHNLKRVWREGYLVAKILQSIRIFKVWDCPSLTTLFPVMTSFQNLTELVVKNSSGLVHLVTVSAITNLMHLTDMTIIGCERMKEVVANDENGERKVISLGKLENLTLQHLPSLECFSSTTSCIFRFPSMDSIEVEECSEMKIFCKSTISTPTLQWVTLFKYKWQGNWEGDLNTTIQKLTT